MYVVFRTRLGNRHIMHRIFPVKYSTDAISPGKCTRVNNLSFGATMLWPANQEPGSEIPWKHGF